MSGALFGLNDSSKYSCIQIQMTLRWIILTNYVASENINNWLDCILFISTGEKQSK